MSECKIALSDVPWDKCPDAQAVVLYEDLPFFTKTEDGRDYFMYLNRFDPTQAPLGEWRYWSDATGFKDKVKAITHLRPVIEEPVIVDHRVDEFENQLPEWAMGKNEHGLLFPGVQLCTRDGRRTGNAHIVCTETKEYGHVYLCLTDAGSKITLTENEVHSMFYVGEYYSSVGRIIKDFDRNQEFMMYPGR